MKLSALLGVCTAIVLTGCISDKVPLASTDLRFNIDAYKEHSATADLTGLWIAIHKGTLNETSDGVDYTVSGSIREIVEVTQAGGVVYLRSCLKPEMKSVVSVSGDNITFAINDEQAQLTKASNTAMSGSATHSTSGSSYTGTLKMKKVAPLNDTFGLFNYLNASLGKDVATASCFQEGSLRVVGSKFSFSKWADVEIANITDWSSSTFHQTGYMFSRAGTADPVKQVRFAEGTVATGSVVREYPANNENVTVSTSTSSDRAYKSSFAVGGVVSGTVDLGFSIAALTTTVSAPVAAASTTAEPTQSGAFDFLAMMSWMAGLMNIQIPW